MDRSDSQTAESIDLDQLQKLIEGYARNKLQEGTPLTANFVHEITRRTLQSLLDAEFDEHLKESNTSSTPPEDTQPVTKNYRNGRGKKKVKTDVGVIDLEPPRDREASFDPKIIPKRSTTLGNFQEKIISLYTRGMSTREIEDHIREMYSIEISPEFVSRAVQTVQADIIEWQNRPLEPFYPIVYIDALMVSVKLDGNRSQIVKKAIYTVLGCTLGGVKEVLGLWIQETEGARFWLKIFQDMQTRGVKDILLLCADGLTGIDEALAATFPQADLQRCVVHQVRNATKFVSYKDRKEFCADMKPIYTAPSVDIAELAFLEFSEKWESKYPASVESWRRNWNHLTTFMNYPSEIRSIVYTTNSIESLHSQMRKNINGRKVFPNDEAVIRLLYLNVKNFSKKWSARQGWDIVVQKFVIMFGERVTKWINF